MIKSFITYSIIFCFFFAIFLKMGGVDYVSPGSPFLVFLNSCNRELNDFLIAIPKIPHYFDEELSHVFIFSAIFNFINFLIDTINGISSIINVLIQLIEFTFIVLKNLIYFKDSLVDSASSVVSSLSSL